MIINKKITPSLVFFTLYIFISDSCLAKVECFSNSNITENKENICNDQSSSYRWDINEIFLNNYGSELVNKNMMEQNKEKDDYKGWTSLYDKSSYIFNNVLRPNKKQMALDEEIFFNNTSSKFYGKESNKIIDTSNSKPSRRRVIKNNEVGQGMMEFKIEDAIEELIIHIDRKCKIVNPPFQCEKFEHMRKNGSIDKDLLLIFFEKEPIIDRKNKKEKGNALYGITPEGKFKIMQNPMHGSKHHSYFNNGKELKMAGAIKIINGDIVYINNESGHYRPKDEEFLLFIEELKQKGIIDSKNLKCQKIKDETVTISENIVPTKEAKVANKIDIDLGTYKSEILDETYQDSSSDDGYRNYNYFLDKNKNKNQKDKDKKLNYYSDDLFF